MTSHRKFVWDGWLLLMELNGTDNAVLRKYTWGLDVAGLDGTINSRETAGGIGGLLAAYDTNGTSGTGDDRTFVYGYDGNGNVGQLIETTAGGNYGTMAVKYEYDPYGGRLKPPAEGEYMQPWRFSTKQWDDETGLGYWGYRYYSASLGRWVSRDPMRDSGAVLIHRLARSLQQPPSTDHNVYRACNNAILSRTDALGLAIATDEQFLYEEPSAGCDQCSEWCDAQEVQDLIRSNPDSEAAVVCIHGCKCACLDNSNPHLSNPDTPYYRAVRKCKLAHEEHHWPAPQNLVQML